jgi:hypothetical protein
VTDQTEVADEKSSRSPLENEIGILERRRIEAGVIAPIFDEMCERFGEEQAKAVIETAIRRAAIESGEHSPLIRLRRAPTSTSRLGTSAQVCRSRVRPLLSHTLFLCGILFLCGMFFAAPRCAAADCPPARRNILFENIETQQSPCI